MLKINSASMAKPTHLIRFSLPFLNHPKPSLLLKPQHLLFHFHHHYHYYTTATPFPLQYDIIISRPVASHPPPTPHRRGLLPKSSNSEPQPDFDNWVDQKLTNSDNDMDKAKRKYYNKKTRRMYGGSNPDEDDRVKNEEEGFVEVKSEVVALGGLHKREEEELNSYDAFAYPWEKDKHYKMVYQLEKKYFPDQCFDKAFLQPGESSSKRSAVEKNDEEEEKGLVFIEEEKKGVEGKGGVEEKKVEEFFKCLKKVPNGDGGVVKGGGGGGEPFVSTRSGGLPGKWDSVTGTVVLVNKPKGWTSFTVCGKLRRLVNVKKVGHAGTLDPMATGLLIVCVGKATKVVDRYQGMIKGYSGVFRLGEATSTLDADSPVIQREPWEHIKDEDLKKTATSFCGEIWQVPPMFSAIKVGGEKMYDKARRGETIELTPRQISIFQFDVERSLDDRKNVIFRVTCSKGTYIRSLCADFAKTLSSCAHLTALRRDSIGQYSADDAWEFKDLEEAITKGYM